MHQIGRQVTTGDQQIIKKYQKWIQKFWADQSVFFLWWSNPVSLTKMHMCSLHIHTGCQTSCQAIQSNLRSAQTSACPVHVYCCEKVVNLFASWVSSMCVWVHRMWARGLQGENEWAHPSEVEHFKLFHSSALQFHLWKRTRNVHSMSASFGRETLRLCLNFSFLSPTLFIIFSLMLDTHSSYVLMFLC